MNRDEFEFGFDPEEEQEARRPKAGNTGHTFVPAFRQAETEGKRPRRAPLSAESRKRIPIWIWTVILTKKRK